MKNKLPLSLEKIDQAKSLARNIANPIQEFIDQHTTDTVERATLRILGADGINANAIPVPNLAVSSVKEHLSHGATRYYINAMLKKDMSVSELNNAIIDGLDISTFELVDFEHIEEKASELIQRFRNRIKDNINHRNQKLDEYDKNKDSPLLYLIVATGNIYEDVKQATAAAEQGADVIAVIRTAGQSLLDYVPYGATTEGFCGTYATQENFKIMRGALDNISEKVKRYVRLVNYCSGLCMPEIATMGAAERLDMMLNDSMYGILFRDINMYRTFIDQHFSRMINSFADIVINTGEDNYLTTSDAYEKAYTVLASQLINAQFASNAGLPHNLTGLGHAFEMDPKIKNGFLYELAQAQMAREIFPDYPLKYMPPTKFMTGSIFRGYAVNTMFNFVSKATNQSIHLLGMLTEGIHTPHIQDRFLAVENAKYVMNNMADFSDEIEFKKDGIIAKRAEEVLNKTIEFLKEVQETGLFNSIEKGMFADIKRKKDGGKGYEGVVKKFPEYWNPVEDFLRKECSSQRLKERKEARKR
ncbi:MAG: D-lysine 5,6-aminomutase alpha subunit [Candidatus Scalindua rubra]|uniref:D-lysine 5,6-aminomutase alpha subunit n=1 Tax=Candidatus Scalindua rubra TaxID=1872076 RepID=A0A1E3X8J8_9BACT|nr:MAG: D-lysine 5,6-aminomutase alpha subunit [Candidatus Scalindua rubra]